MRISPLPKPSKALVRLRERAAAIAAKLAAAEEKFAAKLAAHARRSAPARKGRKGMRTSDPIIKDDGVLLAGLKALAASKPPGTLLAVRTLRKRLPTLTKRRFDASALRLSAAHRLILHHTDFPGGLSEKEKAELIQDERGTYYIGVAPSS